MPWGVRPPHDRAQPRGIRRRLRGGRVLAGGRAVPCHLRAACSSERAGFDARGAAAEEPATSASSMTSCRSPQSTLRLNLWCQARRSEYGSAAFAPGGWCRGSTLAPGRRCAFAHRTAGAVRLHQTAGIGRPQAAEIPYVSNVTGTSITGAEATDPAYWIRHLRQTVRFSDGLKWCPEEIGTLSVGLGPDARDHAGQAPSGREAGTRSWLASLPHAQDPEPEDACVLNALGRLGRRHAHELVSVSRPMRSATRAVADLSVSTAAVLG